MPRLLTLSLLLTLTASLACPGPEGEPVSYRLPRNAFPSFLDAPWPSDVYRQLDPVTGEPGLRLRSFPNPGDVTVLEDFLRLFQTLPHFSKTQVSYFRVEAGLDESSLPQTPTASMQAGASLFIVETEPPYRRIPAEWTMFEGGSSFFPADTVAVAPLLGAVPQHSHAVILTTSARVKSGAPAVASEDLRAVLQCEPVDGAVVEVDCQRYQRLLAGIGLSADDVALVQWIDTGDASAELMTLADQVRETVQPEITVLEKRVDVSDDFEFFEGEVVLQQYIVGRPPYDTVDGVTGTFEVDADGQLVSQGEEVVRFTLTVPRGQTAPAGGWPIVVRSHGTGGSLFTGVADSDRAAGFQIAKAGWASIQTSEPLHLGREGYREGQEELLTFNFLNPPAGKNVWRQSVLEKVQLITAMETLVVPIGVGAVHFFNPERVGFYGHSQGGIVGGVLAGVEPRPLGYFLSGAGGGFAPSLAAKTEPVNLPSIIRTLVGLDESEPLDRFHPILSLFQMWVDPADPINYGDAWNHALASARPHLVVTSGLLDDFTPAINHAGLAGAFGLPLVAPVFQPLEILQIKGIASTGRQARGNLPGGVTGGMLQFDTEGHFAVQRDPGGRRALRNFFATMADGAPIATTDEL